MLPKQTSGSLRLRLLAGASATVLTALNLPLGLGVSLLAAGAPGRAEAAYDFETTSPKSQTQSVNCAKAECTAHISYTNPIEVNSGTAFEGLGNPWDVLVEDDVQTTADNSVAIALRAGGRVEVAASKKFFLQNYVTASTGGVAISIAGGRGEVDNRGTISAGRAGVFLGSAGDIVNRRRIAGDSYAIQSQGGALTVENRGDIVSDAGFGIYSKGATTLIAPESTADGILAAKDAVHVTGTFNLTNLQDIISTGGAGVFVTGAANIENDASEYGLSLKVGAIEGSTYGIRVASGKGFLRNAIDFEVIDDVQTLVIRSHNPRVESTAGDAVRFLAGGTVETAGVIFGNQSAIEISGGLGIVTNLRSDVGEGNIVGTNDPGIKLTGGGSVDNAGRISGREAGIEGKGTSLEVLNRTEGRILSTAGAGVEALGTVAQPLALTLTNEADAAIQGTTRGLYLLLGSGTLVNAGEISASGSGSNAIRTNGSSVAITNEASGTITGVGSGINIIGGVNSSISNSGKIIGLTDGIVATGATSLENFGSVTGVGGRGVQLLSADAIVTNGGSATIAAGTEAVYFKLDGSLENSGAISGGTGVRGGSGGLSLYNAGSISGTVAEAVVMGGGTVENAPGASLLGTTFGLSASQGTDLDNHGLILGATGVRLANGGTLENFATARIEGSSLGIEAVGASLDNAGRISGATGLSLGNGSLVNRPGAVIEATADGIIVPAGGGAVVIDNAGEITAPGAVMRLAEGDDQVILRSGSRLNGGAIFEGVLVVGYEGGLADGGAGRDGLRLEGAGQEDAEFVGFEQLAVAPGASWRLLGDSAFAEEAVIEGELTASGSLAGGLLKVTSTGVLRLEAAGSAALQSAEVAGQVESGGSVTVAGGFLLTDTGALSLLTGSSVTAETADLSGVVLLDGTFESASATLHSGGILEGLGLFRGALEIADGGRLGDLAGLEGSLTVRDGGEVRPGSEGIGAVSITGEATFDSGALLVMQLNGNGNSDRLNVEGILAASDGARLRITELQPSLEESREFTLVSTTGGVAGAFTLEEEFLFFDAELVGDGDSLLAVLERNETQVEDVASSDNQTAVAPVLTPGDGTGTPEFQELIENLLVLEGDAAAGAAALDSLAGDVLASAATSGLLAERGFLESLAGRLASRAAAGSDRRAGALGLVSDRQQAAGPLPRDTQKGALGAWATLDLLVGSIADENAGDLDYSSFGGTVGVDYGILPEVLVGGALGFAATTAEESAGGSTADTTAVRLAAFARWQRQALSLSGVLGASFGSLETSRDIAVGGVTGTAEGSSDSSSFGAAFEAGYELPLAEWRLRPMATFSAATLSQGAFEESGSTGAELAVEEVTQDSLRSGLGMAVTRRVETGGLVLLPEARLAWRHEFLDREASLDARFLGGPASGTDFTVSGVEASADVIELGLGVAVEWKQNLSGFLDYQLAAGDDQLDHAASLGLRYAF